MKLPFRLIVNVRDISCLATIALMATTLSRAQTVTPAAEAPRETAKAHLAAQQRGQQLFDGLPLLFEKNEGQADSRISYLSRGSEYNVYLTGPDAALVKRNHGASESTLRIQWLGASRVEASGEEQIQATTNYFVGRDPAKWHSTTPNFEQVKFSSVYPGIDLVYYGNQHKLEYDLTVAPAADPSLIKLTMDGAKSIEVDKKTGDLIVHEASGAETRLAKPIIYQGSESTRHRVEGGYVLSEQNTISFSVGPYDHNQPLVIDPYVVYSSVIGPTMAGPDNSGSGAGTNFYGMAVDGNGYVYLYGSTQNSIDVPTTTGSFQPACSLYTDPHTSTSVCSNFFVAKFDPTKANAASLLWATYIGGTQLSKDDTNIPSTRYYAEEVDYLGGDLAVDANGYVYFTGISGFSDYPTTTNAFNPACNVNGSSAGGCYGAVITKLSADGSSLLYSTYYLSLPTFFSTATANGSAVEPNLIAVDGSQVVYISAFINTAAGYYTSAPEPITTTDGSFCGTTTLTYLGNPITDYGCDSNFIVAAFDTTKSGAASQVYAIYVLMDVYALAADTAGNAYIAGKSIIPQGTNIAGARTTKPLTYNGFQTSAGPVPAATSDILARLTHAGTSAYTTYIGNYVNSAAITAISVDPNGTAYIGGSVYENLPQVNGLSAVSSYTGSGAFIAKVDTTKTGTASLLYSTYFSSDVAGGVGGSYVSAIGDNGAGQVAFAIQTNADTSDFPLTNQLTQPLLTIYNSPISDNVMVGVIDTTKTGNNALTFLSPINGVTYMDTVALDQAENLYMGGLDSGASSLSPFLAVPGSYMTNSSISSTYLFNWNNQPFFYKVTLAIGITPYSLTFGNQAANTTSASQAVTVTNTNTAAIAFTGISASSQFGETDNCQPSLAVGATCTVNVTFTPTAIGTPIGTLTFTESNISGPQVVYLSGTGVAGAPAPIASFSPTSVAFGNQAVTTTSTAQVVTLTNTGTASLNISNISLVGTNPADFADTSACGTSLAVNASCNISVNFTPQSTTSYSASLSFADSAANSPQTVALTGTGTPAPAPIVSISSTNLAFPNTAVGSTASAMSTTITNTGNVSLSIAGISLGGANPSDFTITANTCGAMLAASASCFLSVTFAPASAASFAASINISDNVSSSPQSITLSGTGTGAPIVAISPTSLTYSTAVGSTSSAQTVTLTNTGNIPLTLATVTLSGSDFAISANTCGSTVAAGSSCAVSITFTPAAATTYPGSLTFSDNVSSSPQTVSLSGTGTGAPAVKLSTTSLTYTTTVGSTSAAQVVTLTNNGNIALTIASVTLSGSAFVITNDTCGTSVAAAASCAVSITFSAAAATSYSGTLTFSDNAATSPQSVSLSGTGTPALTISPTSLTYTTAVGSTSAAQTVTLTNSSSVALMIASVSLSGSAFAVSGDTCGTSLAASSSCSVSITFTPPGATTYSGSLTFTDNAASSPQTVSITGMGIGTPAVSLTPTSLSYSTAAGTTSAAQTVTLTNTGNLPLILASVTVAGGGFAISGNTCGAILAAGASCAVSITFSPTTATTYNGSLTFSDNVSSSPQSISLTGTGTNPADFTLTIATPVQVNVPGTATSLTLTLTPFGGSYNTPIVLSVSGLPPGATASFVPQSVIPGASAASSVLTVQTPAVFAAIARPGSKTPWLASLLIVPLMLLRRRYRIATMLACILLLGVLTSVLSGCGGGYFGPQPKTYSMVVNATSGSLQHSTTLTLTVQ